MNCVIDTNVAVVANGRDTHASVECQIACIEYLQRIASRKNDAIGLDSLGKIMEEYRAHLFHKGQPGIGDAFYKYLHDHMRSDRVITVTITPSDDANGFAELPINNLDRSDRKFLATALGSMGYIVNAVDTDWHQQAELLNHLGIPVLQLCPEHAVQE